MINQSETMTKYGYSLPKNNRSNDPVVCVCDFCGVIYEKPYRAYLRTVSGGSACTSQECINKKRESTSLIKFGETNAFKSSLIKDKIRKSNIDKYGVDNPSKNPDIVNKIRDIHTKRYGGYGILSSDEGKQIFKNTCLEKYGTENPNSLQEIKDKIKNASVEKYGTIHPMMSDVVKEKTFKTNILKYGVKSTLLCPEIKERIKHTNTIKYGADIPSKNDDVVQKIIDTRISRYGTMSTFTASHNRGNTEEQKLTDWLNSLGFSFTQHRISDTKKTVDCYDDNIKLAIEYNGLHWHHENSKTPRDRNYHINKMNDCMKDGVRLISIFSDEWIYRQTQVKSYIKSVLGKCSRRYHARKTKISIIDKKIANEFYESFHIQGGSVTNDISCGMYDGDELIGCMSFGRHHRKNEKQVVLTRLCYRDDCYVVGGASRMFKFLISHTNAECVVSWSDNRWSVGNVYKSLGFVCDEILPPDYSYVCIKKPTKRISKQSQMKKKTNCPPDVTEHEHALSNGLSRIWDCGKIRWIWKKN